MSALAWWLIPVGAVSLTVLYFAFKFRPRPVPQAGDGIKRREKMRDAMNRPLPQSRQ